MNLGRIVPSLNANRSIYRISHVRTSSCLPFQHNKSQSAIFRMEAPVSGIFSSKRFSFSQQDVLRQFGLKINDRNQLERDAPSQFKLKNNLFVVRHSKTDMNQKGITQGRFCRVNGIVFQDPPLSEEGIYLASDAFQNIKSRFPNIGVLISSPQSRALETAKIIHNRCSDNIPLYLSDSFSEVNMGEIEGSPHQLPLESRHTYSVECNVVAQVGKDGEKPIDKLTYLGSALNGLNTMFGHLNQDILIVTHSHTITLLRILLGTGETKVVSGKTIFQLGSMKMKNNDVLIFERSACS